METKDEKYDNQTVTPKEKAAEIVERFSKCCSPLPKLCALIAIDLKLEPLGMDDCGANERQRDYWNEVKEEIAKL